MNFPGFIDLRFRYAGKLCFLPVVVKSSQGS